MKINKNNLAIVILVTFSALMFFMGIMNHYYFRSFVFDYGNYNFAFWDYSHFRISSIPTYPGNFLQDHYSFLLFYFIPVYWLLNWLTGTYTLIIIQNSLIVIAAWYSYKLIRLKSQNLYLTTGVLVYYFLLLGRYSTFACDTNLAVMSACFIPIFIYYFELRKYVVASTIFILSLFSRENIPIWFIFIFIVLIIEHKDNKKAVRLSLAGIIISVLYFILLFKVLIPGVENEAKQFTLFNYSALGPDPGSALKYVVLHPWETVKMFFVNHLDNPNYKWIKVEFYQVYLISGGFILLTRPKYLIWFIPIVAQKVLNDAPIRWGILTYYSIEVVTLLPLSVFLALSSMKSVKLQNNLTLVIVILTLGTTIYKMDRSHRIVPDSFRPEKEKVYDKRFYQSDYYLRKTHRLLKQIPKDSKVSASEDFFPHLAQRFHIYFFPEVRDAEYIVFSVSDDYFRMSHMENERLRNEYLNSSEWEIIAEEFPVFLLHKKSGNRSTQIYDKKSLFRNDTISCDFESIDSIKQIVLFNNGQKADVAKKISTIRAKSEVNSLLLTNEVRYGDAINFEQINQIRYLEASVWCYGDITNAYITAKLENGKAYKSNQIVEKDNDGWNKIELKFWVPSKNADSFFIHLWNSGRDSIYFDNFQIITKK
nr:DUF2079 domain-containing protein [uncultured Draconibacterium sp.]